MLTDVFVDKSVERAIFLALEEDHSFSGDITTIATISETQINEAIFMVKSDCVIAGINIASKVFDIFARCNNYKKINIEWYVQDGEFIKASTIIGKVSGNTRVLLACERVALNIMQRMSGIATKTKQCVDLIKPYKTKILDTRKTAPGLRILDKLAVRIGGGFNHRLGLYDQFLIKDNHIKASDGNICEAIKKVNNFMIAGYAERIPITVEVTNLEQIKQIFDENLDVCISRLLLDNMVKINMTDTTNIIDVTLLKEAVDFIDNRIKTEASGNINELTLNVVASVGVDYVSCGSLTHSVIASDISMKII